MIPSAGAFRLTGLWAMTIWLVLAWSARVRTLLWLPGLSPVVSRSITAAL